MPVYNPNLFRNNLPSADTMTANMRNVFEDSIPNRKEDALKGAVDSYNEKRNAIIQLKNAKDTVNHISTIRTLQRDQREILKYIDQTEQGYNEALRRFNVGYKSAISNLFHGREPADIKAHRMGIVSRIQDAKIRIEMTKAEQDALSEITKFKLDVDQSIAKGDVYEAANSYQSMLGAVNTFTTSGIIEEKFGNLLKKNLIKNFNDNSTQAIFQQAEKIGVISGFKEKQKYFNQASKLINANELDPKLRKTFELYKRSVDQSEINFGKRVTDAGNLIDNFTKFGIGRADHIREEANSIIPAAQLRRRRYAPGSSQHKALTNVINNYKAFDKVYTGLSNAVENGSSSPYIKMLRPMGAKSYRETMQSLGIKDSEQQEAFIQMHGTMLKKYNYNEDPVGAAIRLHNDLQESSGASVSQPERIADKLNQEIKVSEHIFGGARISKQSMQEALDVLGSPNQNGEHLAQKYEVEDIISSNGIRGLGELLLKSKHVGKFPEGTKQFAAFNQDVFRNFNFDPETWDIINTRMSKTPGYKTTLGNVRNFVFQNYGSDLKKIAAAYNTNESIIANSLALDIVQGVANGHGNLANLGFDAINFNTTKGSFSDAIDFNDEGKIDGEISRMVNSIKEKHNTHNQSAILKEGALGRAQTTDAGKRVMQLLSQDAQDFTSPIERALDFIGFGDNLVNLEAKTFRELEVGLSKVTKFTPEQLHGRISIKQSNADNGYYFYISTFEGVNEFLEDKTGNRLLISEEEMQGLIDSNPKESELPISVLRAINGSR